MSDHKGMRARADESRIGRGGSRGLIAAEWKSESSARVKVQGSGRKRLEIHRAPDRHLIHPSLQLGLRLFQLFDFPLSLSTVSPMP